MLRQFGLAEVEQALLHVRQQLNWERSKNLLMVMLGLWISYFFLVNAYVHSLNKIAVPVIGIPLGFYLAVQGAAILFAIVLFRFAKDRG